jgi:murein DD-endopeptidase MepM/ murein hydrolase activator NlpD
MYYAEFLEWAIPYRSYFHKLTEYSPDSEHAIALDLSVYAEIHNLINTKDPIIFSKYLKDKYYSKGISMAVGGYLERRNLYNDKGLFTENQEERNIHLGIDVWMESGAKIFCPYDGKIHSFANNKGNGNYGPTLILEHQFSDNLKFYTLYGHLSLADMPLWQPGKRVSSGELIAHFGNIEENGNWAPHLHFQIILDLGIYQGDYPGVASQKMFNYESRNCPDANIILNCPLL